MLREIVAAPGIDVSAERLRIGGLTPLTSIDFPGRLAAVLFCQGCPWRCGYCHNPELLDATVPGTLAWSRVLAFLQRRRGLLDGVVFSGGEPTLQAALSAALPEVRAMGFETALHTGGMYPERLAALLPQLDWIGLDIKGPLHCHDGITATPGSGPRVRQSLRYLLASGVAHECRTTWHPGLFSVNELLALADELSEIGVTHWALQQCRTPGGAPCALTPVQTQALAARFTHFVLRRA
ncbi:MAG: anaerobic ribonucleoside-triphosphate reductase activating protein [Polaromonas sp.]|uniref:anaerobic ribonucleoside-triphosphate reductase activating protein n=1 Tax=Polaromonas sp. TaxID=1869339 RepID=UPI002730B536|nr:anaerobic ribonucleoside-triphosphate reductase activating protein [Polaromonas sp.]MDP2257169.1 anaerobic ribonucleoside-triphosphate reductase activating protein [Polaromonas sp.]